MNDKRHFKRSPIELAASFGVPEEQEIVSKGTVINISRGGICIKSKKPLRVGTEFMIAIEDEADEIGIGVKVVWSKKDKESNQFINGVTIVETSAEELDKFLDFYSRLSSE